VAGTAR